MESTKTLIFMDLESTCLFDDSNSDTLINSSPKKDLTRHLENIIRSDGRRKPQITEISFVSIPTNLFKEASKQLNNELIIRNKQQKLDFYIPLVTNIQTRQINPQINSNEWINYEILRQRKPNEIKLRKEDLEYKNNFEQEWPGFQQMLSVSPKPVCLIAHNGINFDFRLLIHELNRFNLLDKWPIPEGVYFLDTLSSFQAIDSTFDNEIEITTRNVNWKYIISQNDDEEEEMSEEIIEETNNINCVTFDNLIQPPSFEEQIQITPTKNRDDNNEIISLKNKSAKRCLFPRYNNNQNQTSTPVKFMRTDNWSPAKRRRINFKYFQKSREGNWDFNSHQAKREATGRGKNTLCALQERFFVNGLFSSHRAQGDAEALLQCCLAYGDDFLSYLDKNRALFPTNCFE